jgi:hypothetical protein
MYELLGVGFPAPCLFTDTLGGTESVQSSESGFDCVLVNEPFTRIEPTQ